MNDQRSAALIVAGVMSGTSADGVDVALVRLAGRRFRTRFELLAHRAFPYPADGARGRAQGHECPVDCGQ